MENNCCERDHYLLDTNYCPDCGEKLVMNVYDDGKDNNAVELKFDCLDTRINEKPEFKKLVDDIKKPWPFAMDLTQYPHKNHN